MIIVILVLIGGFFLWSSNANAPAVDQGASSNVSDGGSDLGTGASTNGGATVGVSADVSVEGGGGKLPMSGIVKYDGSLFEPAQITIANGGTITFMDTSGTSMWVASNVHPTHANYDGTSRADHCVTGYTGAKPFDQCAKGSSFSFTFDKAGTFEYHDHANSSATGVVIVK